ncbi:MAG: hypothetical protein IIW08_10195 [Clostridia bacterium]|nr:hypothetical protein [Clostridia bacterium]
MAEIRRVRIRRERASFPALALAFLVFSAVLFLSTIKIRQEKPVYGNTDALQYASSEIELEKIDVSLVTLCGQESRENARITSARYMQRGAAGYLYEKGGKWYSVGNLYFSKAEAEKMAQYISDSGIPASVLPLSQKGVTLRVTAEEEMLDALAFCVNAFSEFERSLADYSQRLDAGELSEREARVLLSVLSYDLSAKRAEAGRALSEEDDHAAGSIFRMYLTLLDTAASLTKNEGGEMMLSARIKYALIESTIQRAELLRRLND